MELNCEYHSYHHIFDVEMLGEYDHGNKNDQKKTSTGISPIAVHSIFICVTKTQS